MLDTFKDLAEELMQTMVNARGGGHKVDMHDGIFGEKFVTYHLLHSGHALPSEISEVMGISTARVAAALNSLEAKGFITREIDKEDRRKIIVSLTKEGKSRAQNQLDEHTLHMAKMLESLGEHDAKEYVRIQARLVENHKSMRAK